MTKLSPDAERLQIQAQHFGHDAETIEIIAQHIEKKGGKELAARIRKNGAPLISGRLENADTRKRHEYFAWYWVVNIVAAESMQIPSVRRARFCAQFELADKKAKSILNGRSGDEVKDIKNDLLGDPRNKEIANKIIDNAEVKGEKAILKIIGDEGGPYFTRASEI